jgi:two-component system, NtrC family, response regulator AtoC
MLEMASQMREFSHSEKKSPAVRVLVVDDEPLIRWSVVETLIERGFEVVEAADGRTAVSEIDGNAGFDVVLLDFRLPDSNDLGLLTRIRRQSPKSQVILMTAYGTPEVTKGALDLGAYRVVSKPFEMSELAALVTQARAAQLH